MSRQRAGDSCPASILTWADARGPAGAGPAGEGTRAPGYPVDGPGGALSR
jgi:hypothetical protein